MFLQKCINKITSYSKIGQLHRISGARSSDEAIGENMIAADLD